MIFAARADPATSRLRYDCTRARNLGLHVLFVHCLTENGAMMHIARRAGNLDLNMDLPKEQKKAAMKVAPDQPASTS